MISLCALVLFLTFSQGIPCDQPNEHRGQNHQLFLQAGDKYTSLLPLTPLIEQPVSKPLVMYTTVGSWTHAQAFYCLNGNSEIPRVSIASQVLQRKRQVCWERSELVMAAVQ